MSVSAIIAAGAFSFPRPWYIAQVRAGSEHTVIRNFKQIAVHAWTPIEIKSRRLGIRQTRKVKKPLFLGYVLVRTDRLEGKFSRIYSIPYFYDFLRNGADYAEIADFFVELIRYEEAMQEQATFDRHQAKQFLYDERVLIRDGKYKGLFAKIAALPTHKRIRYLLELETGGRLLETSASMIEPA